MQKKIDSSKNIEVVDLFCGIGGLSYGLKQKGFKIKGGFDIDNSVKYAFEKNTQSIFQNKDIRLVRDEDIIKLYSKNSIKILAGCAPCQPFSSYSFKHKDKDQSKFDLLYEFGRIIRETKPDIVTMENVPQITSFKQKPVFYDFLNTLHTLGYKTHYQIVYCPDYGIPQTRKRLVLLASLYGDITLITPTHNKENYITVKDVIKDLPPISAGEVSKKDPLHRSRGLSELNLKRIKSTPTGGSWKDWDKELLLECHKKKNGKSFGSVYGRMKWDEPSPTMTTLCTGYGNGRFGHPEQDRAISLREASIFQTFPVSYSFTENLNEINIAKISRQIGNAVPPKLGEVIALSIFNHLTKLTNE